MAFDIGKVSVDRSASPAVDGSGKGSGFMRFIGRVVSALKSIGHKELEPIRPLQTRQVAVATGPLQAPIKQLREAVLAQDRQQLGAKVQAAEQEVKQLEQELSKEIHGLKQLSLNQEIKGFDPGTLKPTETKEADSASEAKYELAHENLDVQLTKMKHSVVMMQVEKGMPLRHVETQVKGGLDTIKLEHQLSGPGDGVFLRPQTLKKPSDPATLLKEPSLQDVKDGLDHMVSKEALKDLAKQVGVRLEKMNGLGRKSPEFKALSKEVGQLADDLGRVLGKLYAAESQATQNAFAIGNGADFKQEVWELLKDVYPKMPDRVGGGDLMATPDKDFLNRVYNTAACQLPNHLSTGDKPTLTFDGSTYEQVKVLGKGGGGIAFLYENKQGDMVVVKSKGFGADYEENIDEASLQEITAELRAHLGLMGESGEGHPNILQILGVARTPFGQPVAILKLAKHGDIDHVIGKREEKGALDQAVAKGLVSPQARTLVNLLILQDAIKGMAYLQEQKGMRQGDFKPGNLFVQGDGTVMVADFGLTKTGLSVPQTEFTGTLDYLPPENFLNHENKSGNITGKADTWAIGIMAHQLFNKAHPFDISKIPGREVADTKMGNLLKPYGTSAQGEREFVTTLSENYEKSASVQGVTALDRLLNALLHPDPEKRPLLSDVLQSAVFDDLGRGANDRTPAVRALLAALSAQPMDEALVKSKAEALGL